uniref:Uncharacterized protein n=1 Tax=Scleropages formosus TaxID=113540 RepID=A0A8C9VK27_SCLFO
SRIAFKTKNLDKILLLRGAWRRSGFGLCLLSGGSGVRVLFGVPCDELVSHPGCAPSPSSLAPCVARLRSSSPRPCLGQVSGPLNLRLGVNCSSLLQLCLVF